MRSLLVPLVSAGLGAIALAQSETSPKGFLTTEGNAYAEQEFGYHTAAYGYGGSYLQIDATNVGQARTLKALSMRRDGVLSTTTTYVGRTVRFGVRVAHVNWSKVKGNVPQEASEFLVAPWTTAMADKDVNLPSLVQKPGNGTAPFSVVLQFDNNFAHNGSDAIGFHILTSPSSDLAVNFSDYPVDFTSNNPGVSQQVLYGTGCIPTGNGATMRHNSYLMQWGPNSNANWDLGSSRAPASAPIVTVIGLTNPFLAFGACEKLYAMPDVTLSAVTNVNGTLFQTLSFPHKPEFIGAKVYSQSAAYDAGKAPIALSLSQGISIVYPAEPSLPAVTNASQLVHWATQSWPTSHKLYPGSGIIFGLHE